MRVLHLLTSLTAAGIPGVVTTTAPALAERGVEVHVAAFEADDAAAESLTARAGGDAAVLHRPTFGFGVHRRGWLGALARWDAGRLVRRTGADVVHVHYPPLDRAFLDVRDRGGPPVVASHYSTTPARFFEHEEARRRHEEDFRHRNQTVRADRVLAISRFAADDLRERTPGAPDDVPVVHPGVDLEAFRPADPPPAPVDPDAPPGEPGAPRLTALGRLSPHKGILEVIQAFALVRDRYPNALLDVIGRGGGSYFKRVRERAGSVPGVTLRGGLPAADVRAALARSHLLIGGSFHEGFGLPYLEAQACGTPVVAFDAGATKEVVADGETGVLAPAGDVAALGDGAMALLGDADRLAEARRAARARAESFSPARTAEGFIEAYEAVTA